MEDDSGEKHIRLVYFLANGCTKLARALVERHVELEISKSPTHSQGVWSLDDFLYENMQKLSHVQGKQRHKLFPGRYKDTNIDEWDLNLLCLVISSCTENNELKQDWNQLKSIRNEVYHVGNTNIKTAQFQHFVEVIEVIVERCCKFIGKEEFTQDMKGMLENFKNGQITRNDKDMQKFRQWYESDPMAVVLQKVDGLSQENQLLMTKMDELLNLVKSMGLKGVVLPDTNVELIVKNCDKAKEKVISDHLVNLLKMKITVDIPAADKERILQAAKDAMTELLAGGRELTDVYQACVNLKIKCPSYKNMRALWEDCMTGRLTGVFKTLEKYARLLSGCPDVELEVGITQFELYRCMEAIVTEIAKTLRAGNEDIFTEQTNTFKEITVTSLDSENTKKSARHLTENLGDSSKETDGTHIQLQIKPTTFCQAENLWEAFQSGSFNKKLENLAETFRKVFDMDELRITGKMEEASPYEELFRKKKRLFGADERQDEFEDLDEEVESFDGESWTEAADMQKEPHHTPIADSTIGGRVKSLCDAHQEFQSTLETLAMYLGKLDNKIIEKEETESILRDLEIVSRHNSRNLDKDMAKKKQSLQEAVSEFNRDIQGFEDTVVAMKKELRDIFQKIKDALSSVLPDLKGEIKREQAELAKKYIEFMSSEIAEILASWCSDVGYVLYEMKETDIARWKQLEIESAKHLSDIQDDAFSSAYHYMQTTFLDFVGSTFMVTNQNSYCIRLYKNQMPKITVSFLALNRTDLRGVTVRAISVKENDPAFTREDIDEHLPGHLKLKWPEKHFSRRHLSEAFEVTYDKLDFELEDYQRLLSYHSETSYFEQLYRFVFFTSIEGRKFWTLSLPVVVTTDPRQSCCALASVMWHCYKTDVLTLPLKKKTNLPWSHVAEMLKTKFLRLCQARTLTEGNLTHLKRRLLGSEHVPDNTPVTLKRFCYEPMSVNCTFSFWKWFLGNYNLVDAYLRPYWQDGLIEGFVSRCDVERMFGGLSKVKSGTFLLRFSDNHITDSVGTKSVFGILTSMVALRMEEKGAISTRLEAIEVANHTKLRSRSLANILKESMDKTRVNHIYRFVFPGDRKRDDCFDQHCSEDRGLNGYVGRQDVFIFDLEQQMLALNASRSRLGSGSSGSGDSGICPTPESPRSLSPANMDIRNKMPGVYYHAESVMELPVSLSTPSSPDDATLNAESLFPSGRDGSSSENEAPSEGSDGDLVDTFVNLLTNLAKDSPQKFSHIMKVLLAQIEKDVLELVLELSKLNVFADDNFKVAQRK